MSKTKNQAASLLREIKARGKAPAEIARREQERLDRAEHDRQMQELWEAPIRADERRKVAEEIAPLADVAREDCRDPWTVMQQMRARLLRLPPCPHCHAPAGEPCRSHFGGEAMRQTHRTRAHATDNPTTDLPDPNREARP